MPRRLGLLRKKYCTLEMLLLISEQMHQDSSKWSSCLRAQWEEFDRDYYNNIYGLYLELRSQAYRHGEYYVFEKKERGKVRKIYASSPKDRIVDKLLSMILEDTFTPLLERNVYGSIKGRGQHECRDRVKRAVRSSDYPYAASSDIAKYYPTCDPTRILAIIKTKIKYKWAIWLATEFLSVGEIVLGNTSSNIMGHINMFEIDRIMVRAYKLKHYYRYCDDVIIISEDKSYLHTVIREYINLVSSNKQKVKPNWAIYPVRKRRADFLGAMISESNAKLRKKSRVKIESELRHYCNKGIAPDRAVRYWGGVSGSFKGIEMSNLLKHWNNEYSEFFDRLRERREASVASNERKRKRAKVEAQLSTARDCRSNRIRAEYPIR